MKKFLVSCGGTGGHLSPGIALAEGLLARGHDVTLLISRKRVDARLIEKYPALRFVRQPGTGFSWRPLGFARCMVSQMHGILFCLGLCRRLKPDVVVGLGGFTSVGVVISARLRGIPVVLHESNRVPGLAIRAMGRLARRVYLPPGIRVAGVRISAMRHVGLPLRREMERRQPAGARAALGLEPDRKVLVVLGGSQGASPLNDWARRELQSLAAAGVQVYCVTGLGKGDGETVALRSRAGDPVTSVFSPFCDRMAELLSAADLVVSRAGAGTLAELIRCEAPAILIPYPHAADDHQRANAAFFERQGGGLAIGQAALPGLRDEVLDVIFNDWLLRQFRANLRRMDRNNSLDLILDDLQDIAQVPDLPGPGTEHASFA